MTNEMIINIFKKDKVKKGAYLYSIHGENGDKYFQEQTLRFFTLYPSAIIHEPFKSPNNSNCIVCKLKEDIEVLNISIDTYYNNPLVDNYDKEDYQYFDYRDPSHQTVMTDPLFRCLPHKKGSYNHQVCNFNLKKILKPDVKVVGASSFDEFTRDSGKKALHLIMFKNPNFATMRDIYYGTFLQKIGVPQFVYHTGAVIHQGKKTYYYFEIFLSDRSLVEYLNIQKGECQNLYPLPAQVPKNTKTTKKKYTRKNQSQKLNYTHSKKN
jgi:hypothetical protein